MREVRSPNLFEQMKGHGVRLIKEDDLRSVTPDARAKTHFVIVDPIGLCEHAPVEAPPLYCDRNITFEKLIEAVGFDSTAEAGLRHLVQTKDVLVVFVNREWRLKSEVPS